MTEASNTPLVELARLDELDKQEFRDVARAINPAITDEEFDRDWAEFVALKAKKAMQ